MNLHDPQNPDAVPYQNLSTQLITCVNTFYDFISLEISPANFRQGLCSEDSRMFCGFRSMWTTFFSLKNFKAEAKELLSYNKVDNKQPHTQLLQKLFRRILIKHAVLSY